MNGVSSVRDMGITSRLASYVIKAGAIYSMADHRAVYRAMALRDEWIVAVSQDPNGLVGLVTASAHVIDDPTLTLLPAFDDSHNHMIVAADGIGLIQPGQAHSIPELLQLIRQQAEGTPGRADC